MHVFAACFRKDAARWLRDRAALAAWIGIPLFVGLLLALVFGRGETRPQGLLLVADLDQTGVSRSFTQAFAQGGLARMITVQSVELDDGERRIRRGGAAALLVIPKGFSTRFLLGEPQTLRLWTNPSQPILPAIIQETASTLAEAGWYIQQALGPELRSMAAADALPADASVVVLAIKINTLLRRGRAFLDPPAIALEQRSVAARPAVNMAAAMAPGVVFMALLFLAFGLSADLWEEKAAGTLRRIAASPLSPELFLASKTLAAALLMALVSSIGLALSHWLAGSSLAALAPAALWAVLSGCGLFLLMALVQMACRSARQGRTLANVAALLLIMAGGAMFPFEAMPGALARFGRLTPNGWALSELRSILAGTAENLPWKIAALGLAILGLYCAASLRLRKGFLS